MSSPWTHLEPFPVGYYVDPLAVAFPGTKQCTLCMKYGVSSSNALTRLRCQTVVWSDKQHTCGVQAELSASSGSHRPPCTQ